MADSQREERRSYRRRDSDNEWANEHAAPSSRRERIAQDSELSIPGVRRIRVERQDGRDTERRRSASSRKIASESYATQPSEESLSSHRRRRHHHRSPDDESPGKRASISRDESPSRYLHGTPSRTSRRSPVAESGTRRLESDEESSDSEEEVSRRSGTSHKSPRKRKVKVVYITEEDYHSSKQKERGQRTDRKRVESAKEDDSVRRSRTHRSRKSVAEPTVAPPSNRSSSIREVPNRAPSLRRGHSTSSHIKSTKQHAPSLTTTASNATGKRASSHFINNFFGPPVHHTQEPERLVECLTCLSDDIPRSKSAKLKCGHRMCHDCLRRIFKLSVTDPQHMPPKCCTTDHIPLKHVERLFDLNFKKKWNRKFQEYSTKNRIYCPARRCGEWIKPGNIHSEDGKKYGKCGRCKTKVCCLCNGKWHGSRDCPKDEETNKLLAAAKEAGWQRCYSCRTMVELKEGCNHMTCHCTAEFCMICGLKWKSCNCPWFNYDAVEADRLNHMQIPQPVPPQDDPVPRPPRDRQRRPRPNTYVEEIDERRRQEREDEGLARRLQNFDMSDDYQGGIGDIHGVGNGAGHFMNQDYIRAAHNILTGTFDHATAAANYVMGVRQARGGPPPPPRRMSERYPVAAPAPPPPPPMLRRHTMMEEVYNNAPSTRPSERVVPRRTRTDYESEVAVHTPYSRRLDREVSTREGPNRIIPLRAVERTASTRSSDREASTKRSVLAGLGTRRGGDRVGAWRSFVEPGVEPEEGVLSFV